MACIDASAEVERAFRESLKRAMRLTLARDRLDLFDAAGIALRHLTLALKRPRRRTHRTRGNVVATRQVSRQ